MKEAIVVFLVALVVGAGINGFGPSWSLFGVPPSQNPTQETPTTDGAAESSMLPEVSDSDFQPNVIDSDKLVLVEFYTPGNVPCKEMAPVIEKLSTQYGDSLKVVRMDVASQKSVETSSKYGINLAPTYMFFKGGERVDSYVGVVPKEILVAAITKQTATH